MRLLQFMKEQQTTVLMTNNEIKNNGNLSRFPFRLLTNPPFLGGFVSYILDF